MTGFLENQEEIKSVGLNTGTVVAVLSHVLKNGSTGTTIKSNGFWTPEFMLQLTTVPVQHVHPKYQLEPL